MSEDKIESPRNLIKLFKEKRLKREQNEREIMRGETEILLMCELYFTDTSLLVGQQHLARRAHTFVTTNQVATHETTQVVVQSTLIDVCK